MMNEYSINEWRMIVEWIKVKNSENRRKRFDCRNVKLYEEIKNGVYDNRMFLLQDNGVKNDK